MMPFKTRIRVKRLWLILVVVAENLIFFNGYAVTASFSSSLVSGCSPLYVSFFNTSTGATSYAWNFGNGNGSVEVNPVATFSNPGVYTVTLVATGPDGSASVSHTVTVFQNPVADFYSSPTSGCQPLNVGLVETCTPGSGTLQSWLWYMGDGNTQTTSSPAPLNYTYSSPGSYTVGLKVVDANGCEDSEIKTNYITVYPKPQVSISASPTMGCEAPLQVQFSSIIVNGGNPVWNFGDGGSSTLPNPIHTYTTLGLFDVILTAISPQGCMNSTTSQDLIQIQPINAQFSVEDTICAGDFPQIVNFTSGANEFFWNIDGTAYPGLVPNPFPITTGGIHTITLYASTNGSCNTPVSHTFFVESNNVQINPSFNFVCQIPDTVPLQPLVTSSVSGNSYSWAWSVPEINFSTSDQVAEVDLHMNDTLTLNSHDFYGCSLVWTSAFGCTDSVSSDTCIWIDLPVCAYFIFDYDACVPDSVSLINASSYNSPYDTVASYQWGLWDYGYYNGFEPSPFIWWVGGDYLVTLQLTTAQGCVATYEQPAFAEDSIPTIPPFNYSMADTSCAYPGIQLNTDLIISSDYSWSFSDGNWIDNIQDPLIIPVDTGDLSVTLIACNGVCCSYQNLNLESYIQGPVSFFSYTRSCDDPLGIQFFPDSSFNTHPILGNIVLPFTNGGFVDVDRFYWDFDDGSPLDSLNQAPYHHFPGSGSYTVSLTSFNDSSGCSFFMDTTILVKDLHASLVATPQSACVNTLIHFDATGTVDNTMWIDNCFEMWYTIFFDDGTGMFLQDSVFCNPTYNIPTQGEIDHAYVNAGLYDVFVIASDTFGCRDTAWVTVQILGPDASFQTEPFQGCVPLHSTFTPLMLADPSAETWSWSINNVPVGSTPVLEHDFTQEGYFTVQLAIQDTLGCSDTVEVVDCVHAVNPIPQISLSDPQICPFDTLNLWIDPPIDGADFVWVIGTDTLSGDTVNFIPQYPGQFGVELTVSQAGCVRNFSFPSAFTSLGAVIDFTMGGENAYCLPAFVQCGYSATGNTINWLLWSFGDGSFSNAPNPIHLYQNAGDYVVSLSTTTSAGCFPFTQSTLVHVQGATADFEITPWISCLGDSVEFTLLNASNLAGYILDFGDGSPPASQLPVKHAYLNAPLNGKVFPSLIHWAQDSTCVSVDSDSIRFFLVRAWFSRGMDGLDSDTTGCEPFALQLINQSIGADLFHWEFGDGTESAETNPAHVYEVPGTYEISLEVWNQQYGCHFANSKQVSVFETPDPFIQGEPQVCAGSEVQFYSNGAGELQWSPDSLFLDAHAQNPVGVFHTPLEVFLFETNVFNCTGQDSLDLFVQPVPSIPLQDTAIVVGQVIQLSGSGPFQVEYQWSPPTGLLCPSCYNPVFQPLASDWYSVTMTAYIDDSVCFVVTDSLFIDVMNEFSIDMPQMFTPNGDGFNDAVYVHGWGLKELEEYKLFNRWGQCVFSTQDLMQGWDGRFNGLPQPPDSYAYQVIAIGYDGKTYRKKGLIALVR